MKHLKKELDILSNVCEVRAIYSIKVPAKDRVKIINPDVPHGILKSFYDKTGMMEQKEIFTCLYLDRSNKVLGLAKISEGSNCATIVDIQYIFRLALLMNASQVILCHNHPSGTTTPSEADRLITRKLKDAGELMDIKIIDHIIITSDSYLSFAQECLL